MRLRPPGYGDENPPMPVRNTQIHINPASGQLELVDLSKRFMKAAQYWSMPEEFAGYKVPRLIVILFANPDNPTYDKHNLSIKRGYYYFILLSCVMTDLQL